MTKSQIIDLVAKKARMTRKAASEAVEVFLEEIKKNVQRGEKVVLSGFGTFMLGTIADKKVEPFGTGVKKLVKKHRVVRFRPGKPFKKIVR